MLLKRWVRHYLGQVLLSPSLQAILPELLVFDRISTYFSVDHAFDFHQYVDFHAALCMYMHGLMGWLHITIPDNEYMCAIPPRLLHFSAFIVYVLLTSLLCTINTQDLFEGLEDADDLNLLTYLNDELPSQLLSSMLEP